MILLVFPNQLFEHHPGLDRDPDRIVLVEDSLFFGDAQYPLRFHKQKLWLHRATMKRYQWSLQNRGFKVDYVEYDPGPDSLRNLAAKLCKSSGNKQAIFATAHPTDLILEKRLNRISREFRAQLEFLPNPGFTNRPEENSQYRESRNRWFMADFYKWQRQRLNILMDQNEPLGGKWSFDSENRKRVPKKLLARIPSFPGRENDAIDEEARKYVKRRFPDNPGSIDQLYFPTSHQASKDWLVDFLEHRFPSFGDYEDAMVRGESWLWHSVLTPALNIGLLTPEQVLKAALDCAEHNDIPINSLEGFIRQIIGWREFVRATYQDVGVKMRTTNHWDHHRKIPRSFYDGTTGILPVDDTIRRILQTGYCHHIERLMVLGGFMFLCEFQPDEIYNWFMEMFVDSYDWVMVPNVYSMSQHADGGLITTKPYFSGSSYILKMSNYQRDAWCDVWDGLYWRWIWNHSGELSKNARWAMMCSTAKKMDAGKRQQHIENAEAFLSSMNF